MIILAVSILFLSICRAVFALMAWLWPDFMRSQIDEAWDVLQKVTLFYLLKSYFGRISNLVQTLAGRQRVLLSLFLLSFALNAMAIDMGFIFKEWLRGYSLTDACLNLLNTVLYNSLFNAVTAHLVAGILGTLFDALSLLATVWLLGLAAKAQKPSVMWLHIIFDIIFAASGILLALVMIPLMSWGIFGSYSDFSTAWAITYEFEGDHWMPIFMGVSGAVPTVIYLLTGLALAVFVLPIQGQLRAAISHVLFSLAVSDKPLFHNVGTGINYLIAILGAIIALIKVLGI